MGDKKMNLLITKKCKWLELKTSTNPDGTKEAPLFCKVSKCDGFNEICPNHWVRYTKIEKFWNRLVMKFISWLFREGHL
ncbi:MAG: hypothetical protein PHP92_04255 [Candidatus Nanoarchaeia archaeon]|nr:hypothetical protein [Candidatus Nanoarchaeia archaeon]